MLQLTNEELDWICERLPDSPRSPRGGRPVADKRQVVEGIFWVLDNGAKWKDLPPEFGSKSTVHRWFKKWAQSGVFEAIMRDAGRLVESRGEYRLYECFIDATFSKAKGGGDGIGPTKVGKGIKIMILVDAAGLPVAVDTAPANRAENRLVQQLFDFMLPKQPPPRVIGDKAYDSDAWMLNSQSNPSSSSLRTGRTGALRTRPKTAAHSADTNAAGPWKEQSPGSSIIGGSASAGNARQFSFKHSFTSLVP